MAYGELSLTLQNLILVNFEFFLKILLLLIPLVFSFLYIYFFRPNQEKTPYVLVSLGRSILLLLSNIYVWFFPMTLLFLYPTVAIDVLLRFLISTYMIGTIVVGIIMLINIMWFGATLTLKFGGFDIDAERTNMFLNKVMPKKYVKQINNTMRAVTEDVWKEE